MWSGIGWNSHMNTGNQTFAATRHAPITRHFHAVVVLLWTTQRDACELSQQSASADAMGAINMQPNSNARFVDCPRERRK